MSDENFEAYWKDRCAKQRPHSTVNLKTVAEEAWQASRAALKVELPDGDPGEVGPRKFVIEEVKEALQQAGIEVVK